MPSHKVAEKVEERVAEKHCRDREHRHGGSAQGPRRHRGSAGNQRQCGRHRHPDRFRKNDQEDDEISMMEDEREDMVHLG